MDSEVLMRVTRETFADDPAAAVLEQLIKMLQNTAEAGTELASIQQSANQNLKKQIQMLEANNISITATCSELQDQVSLLQSREEK